MGMNSSLLGVRLLVPPDSMTPSSITSSSLASEEEHGIDQAEGSATEDVDGARADADDEQPFRLRAYVGISAPPSS